MFLLILKPNLTKLLYLFILLFILFTSNNLYAQKITFKKLLLTPDTTIIKKPTPLVAWDTRLSLINREWVTFKGIKVGIKVGEKRHRVAFAYRWLTFEKNINLFSFGVPLNKIVNKSYFTTQDAYFYTLSYDHYWLQKRKYAIATPLEIGWGAIFDSNIPISDNLKVWQRPQTYFPIIVGIYGEYKTTRYIGLNSRIGYRYIFSEPRTEIPSIKGVYLDFGLKLYIGALYRDSKKLLF